MSTQFCQKNADLANRLVSRHAVIVEDFKQQLLLLKFLILDVKLVSLVENWIRAFSVHFGNINSFAAWHELSFDKHVQELLVIFWR